MLLALVHLLRVRFFVRFEEAAALVALVGGRREGGNAVADTERAFVGQKL